ncbi:MAG: hypothetical protein WCK65_13900, partial [Rhodospirillaceae bacterium]
MVTPQANEKVNRWLIRCWHVLACLLPLSAVLAGCASDQPAGPKMLRTRLGAHPDMVRLVADMTHQVNFQVLNQESPYRVIAEFPGLAPSDIAAPVHGVGIVKLQRAELGDDGVTRVVLDLAGPVRVRQAIFMPGADKAEGVRFVLDLQPISRAEFMQDMEHGLGTVGIVQPTPEAPSGIPAVPLIKAPDADPGHPVGSAGPIWTSKPYTHFARNQSLADVLRDLAASQGFGAVVSDKVQATVNGAFENY